MARVVQNRNFWVMFIGDALLVAFSYYIAHDIRFDGDIPADSLDLFFKSFTWVVPVKLICFILFKLYRGMWRYTSLYDMFAVLKASLAASGAVLMLAVIAVRLAGFSRGVLIIDFFLTFLLISGFRVSVRLRYSEAKKKGLGLLKKRGTPAKKILIVGAGNVGEKLLREINENPDARCEVVGFIDDDANKLSHSIHGVPILGTLQDLEAISEENGVNEIVIAAPSASAMQMRRMVNFCKNTGLPYKTVPGFYELVEGKVSVSALREVRYEDLLGREPVCLQIDRIGDYVTGKRVMVSGGAGSIGSELCRQIAQFNPKRLILVDRNESALYEAELELRRRYPGLNTAAVLAAVQHDGRMRRIFENHRPQVVFHAAAYKHVPMMEIFPWEAVYNNILGSWAVLDFCQKFAVERCVIVSTDKAVRPTNVMGASKRIVEILMQAYASQNGVKFMAVRFGNVVGSIGSVVPLFRRQIEMGGPVTVTHPEVTRYFMTIPEACSLILQAGCIGKGGEIFVLKMGTPIRIADMAKDIITLSGFKPGEEIEIKYTGLRPGEKLFEELITDGEGITPTEHDDIMVLNTDCCMPIEVIREHIETLLILAKGENARGIKEEIKRMVPEYQPQFDTDRVESERDAANSQGRSEDSYTLEN